jgi:hypothetical protein
VIIIIYPIFFSINYWKTIDNIGKTIIIIYVRRIYPDRGKSGTARKAQTAIAPPARGKPDRLRLQSEPGEQLPG